jgi:hypothetical protein
MVCSILGCAQARSVSGSPPLNHERVFAGTHAHANLGFPPVSQQRYNFRENSGLREDIRTKIIKKEKTEKRVTDLTQITDPDLGRQEWSP